MQVAARHGAALTGRTEFATRLWTLARSLSPGSVFEWEVANGTLHLRHLSVPGMAPHGIGTKFLASVLDLADAAGLDQVLEADNTDEPGDPGLFDLVRWYWRFGFRPTGLDDQERPILRRAASASRGGALASYEDARATDLNREAFDDWLEAAGTAPAHPQPR